MTSSARFTGREQPAPSLVQNRLKRLEASLDGSDIDHQVRIDAPANTSRPILDSFVAFLPPARFFSSDSVALAQVLSEEEYFAARNPSIAKLPGARRKASISALKNTEPALWLSYSEHLRLVEITNQFIRGSGRYQLTARGKINTYALFAELFLRLPGPYGRCGLIVPTGIATDDGNKEFFDELVRNGRLASLLSLENEEFVFPSVHHAYKFSLLTLASIREPKHEPEFAFYARQAYQIHDPLRRFSLSASDISLINPNTRTCPVFRTRQDADLTKRLYQAGRIFIRETANGDESDWNAIVLQNFFSTSNKEDQRLLTFAADYDPSGEILDPVWRGAMIDQFDHIATKYDATTQQFIGTSPADRALPCAAMSSDKYVPVGEATSRLMQRGWQHSWLLGFRRIARATDERTLIAEVLPILPTDDSLSIILPMNINYKQVACLLGNINSLTSDYAIQQKIVGTDIRKYVIAQIPLLPPATFKGSVVDFLASHILELTYTADDMRPWAEDLGYTGPPFGWDEDRRAHLRADLDAAYAHLYGLTRDELRYILDPTDIYGPDFPSETFRVLKEREKRQFNGDYRTARLVLAAWDRLTADGTFASWTR